MTKGPETILSEVNDPSDVSQSRRRTNIGVNAQLARDAQTAANAEKSMTLWEGMKAYPKAAGWSVVISLATTMDGYDTGFLGALLGLVSFTLPLPPHSTILHGLTLSFPRFSACV
jgi:hypothetical protein